ncbi:MAG: hypothetical protein LQ350_004663 [Teloschistes chrysophthalmus]|nr:MAG: hypothetical protein LQ350_004663 [Niorma chrysophthalma]
MPSTDSPATRTRSKAKASTGPAKADSAKKSKPLPQHPPAHSDQPSPLPKKTPGKRKREDSEQNGPPPASEEHSSPLRKSSSKRKRELSVELPDDVPDDLRDTIADLRAKSKEEKNKKLETVGSDNERRLRSTRSFAPKSYLQKLERAQSQRMFVLSRTRSGTPTVPTETVEMAGTTGNIYHITIALEPNCTCPDNKKGNQCKHIVYVLYNVLKAPEDLRYQIAFLSAELRQIFDQAPGIPASQQPSSSSPSSPSKNPSSAPEKEEEDSNRKPIEGDCPICYTEFSPPSSSSSSAEKIIYCKAACGNNVHSECFEQWAATATATAPPRCVYCRAVWQWDERELLENARKKGGGGNVNEEGYVNVGEQLGLSGMRDTSSYHQPWVSRQRRRRGWY